MVTTWFMQSDSYPNSVGCAHAEKDGESMALLVAARGCESAGRIFSGIVVGIRSEFPTVPKSEDMAPQSAYLLNRRRPWPCKLKADIVDPSAADASNDMATVVVLVVAKGGKPAAVRNRKKHWTGWLVATPCFSVLKF